MPTFKLEIVTPEGLIFEGDVEHVRAPGVKGSFGVLAGHTPFITPLDVGEIDVRSEGKEMVYATSGGLADVQAGKYLILAETVELAGDIDVERAKSSRERALKLIEERKKDKEIDLERARASVKRAENRMRIAAR